jgi:uncharacterized cupredoxin-like copper-binding protein
MREVAMGGQGRIGTLGTVLWRRAMVPPTLTVMLLALAGCSKGEVAASAPALPVYKVSVQKFKYGGMPASIKSGEAIITFTNRESGKIAHEMVVLGLQSGQTTDDVAAAAKAKGEDAEGDWPSFGEIADVRTGGTAAAVFSLPPGTYAFACFEKGKLGGGEGPVHATVGMVYQVTVT